MTARATRRLLTAVLALALATTACSGVADTLTEQAAEQIAEQAAGERVDIDVGDAGGSLRVETSEGTLDIGGGTLPEDFPEFVPLPDDHQVLSSMTQGGTDGSSAFVTVTTPLAFEDAVTTISSELEDDGWTIEDTSRMSADDFASTTFTVSRDDWSGAVSLSAADEGTRVTYMLEQGAA